MTDQTYPHDMAVEAKLCAMIVTNPGGSPRPQAWQQRVNELIRAQAKEIADLRADCDTLKKGRLQQEMVIQQLKRERDAALAGAVQVKPLVWEVDNSQIPHHAISSYSGFFRYTILHHFVGMNEVVYRLKGFLHTKGGWDYPTEDLAKEAAQDDHEARIRAALEPDPERAAKAIEALDRIAGYRGPYNMPFPENIDGYPSFAVVTAREALAAMRG